MKPTYEVRSNDSRILGEHFQVWCVDKVHNVNVCIFTARRKIQAEFWRLTHVWKQSRYYH